jgi:hypothetical protein
MDMAVISPIGFADGIRIQLRPSYRRQRCDAKDAVKGLMKTSYQLAMQQHDQAVAAGCARDVCHCCSARVREGLKGCFELFLERCTLGYAPPEYRQAMFYGVDAHALQHPEIHGRKSIAGHLLRLHWIFEHGEHARVGRVPQWWQQYLECEEIQYLEPPKLRGAVTVTDEVLVAAETAREHAAAMQYWAWSVYQAWHEHHEWAAETLARALNVYAGCSASDIQPNI